MEIVLRIKKFMFLMLYLLKMDFIFSVNMMIEFDLKIKYIIRCKFLGLS